MNTHANRPFPFYTWIGLLVLVGGQLFFYLGVRFVAVWLTPIMWTGYIIFMDGLVYQRRGSSWLTNRRREFPFLMLFSVLIWLLFEVYNFKLRNWYYAGVPETPWVRDLAYFWSFATILPGVFETIDFLTAFLPPSWLKPTLTSRRFTVGSAALWFTAGLAMVSIPPLLPTDMAAYLFAPVWIGFILLVDPINQRMGLPSVRQAVHIGQWRRLVLILAGGLICGVIWESWNYQAYLAQGGHWIYTVPQGLRLFGLHYGQMPVLGLLGFPPFALELVLLYSAIRKIMSFQWMRNEKSDDHPLLPWKLVKNQ